MIESLRFHTRHAWFNLREQFSDIPTAVAANALIPFFVWILSTMWEKFNSHQGNFTLKEIILYIGITELLFMTFVRIGSISRASGDFSLALARPRSWLVMSFSGLVGRSTGGRIFMLLMLMIAFPLLGADVKHMFESTLRFFIILPWLAVLQGLFALLFACAQVLWHQVNYFLMPFGKIFLVLGGVWGPVCDFADPWKSALLKMPPADLFFQPAYFCVKGHFYEITPTTWLIRTGTLAIILAAANLYFFNYAKKEHQSYGG